MDYTQALVVRNTLDVVKLVVSGKPISKQDLENYIDDDIVFDPPLPKLTSPGFRDQVYKRTNTGFGNTRESVIIDGKLVTGLIHNVFFNKNGNWIMFG